jgi:hypothetical protein
MNKKAKSEKRDGKQKFSPVLIRKPIEFQQYCLAKNVGFPLFREWARSL